MIDRLKYMIQGNLGGRKYQNLIDGVYGRGRMGVCSLPPSWKACIRGLLTLRYTMPYNLKFTVQIIHRVFDLGV